MIIRLPELQKKNQDINKDSIFLNYVYTWNAVFPPEFLR